ncbi:hypothetical protein CTAYLR_007948 [Chrysophaeum taylorii]|uniref:DNA topoisomerase (ATP-hydrolyzing) n=1 Tax=Chrysophaeum taylorii TaxID=2483200 RepID=A0AAD7UMX2_9STRA|nr:hypothetical protein CTAYLR_007948 [Chrysophaeum taylorii]
MTLRSFLVWLVLGGAASAARNETLCCEPSRCWPRVWVLGAAKAGTTSVALALAEWVCRAKVAGVNSGGPAWMAKETYVWHRVVDGEIDPTALGEVMGELYPPRPQCSHGFLEATPTNLMVGRVAAVARRAVPAIFWESLRFVVILREPVARDVSAYAHQRKKGHVWVPGCPAAKFSSYDDYATCVLGLPRRDAPEFRNGLWAGMYAAQLRAWWAVVPRFQFLVVGFEQHLVEKSADFLPRLSRFLEIPEIMTSLPRKNHHAPPSIPRCETRDLLAAVFEPENQKLYAMLGDAKRHPLEPPKRKKATPPTTVTTNADEVLAAVRRERESRRAADGTVPAASLDMSGLRVVQEMGSEEVGEAIEELFVAAAESIARKESYSFAVPSRSASNQAYVPELDRVVLKANSSKRSLANVGQARKTAIMTRVLSLVHEVVGKGIHVTKRDLFYTDVKLFKKQDESDAVLDDAACTIGCPRSCLNVVAADKGLVVGRLSFLEDGDPIDCTRMGVTGKAIPSYIDKITDVRSDAEFILLVEKDAAYNRLAEDRFYNQFPCILLTGKGQPDVATRMFLRRIAAQLRLPVLAFVDSDPYGLKILSVYMSGSKAMSYDSNSLTTPNIKWLGLRPSDLDAYDLPDQCRLPMTPKDIEMGNHLLKEDFVRKNPKWVAELETMQRTKQKAEIQALSAFGFQFVTQVYLPTKLKQGDWI